MDVAQKTKRISRMGEKERTAVELMRPLKLGAYELKYR